MNESIPVTESSPETAKAGLDIHEILKILPHRYPFLLIDRVLDLERKKRIVAIKNVTINEPFFIGHFPGLPIMPGVLIVEAIAQAGGALLLTEVEDRSDKVMVFTGIERAKFRRPVSPGDQLRLEVEVTGWRSVPGMTAAKMQGYAYVGESAWPRRSFLPVGRQLPRRERLDRWRNRRQLNRRVREFRAAEDVSRLRLSVSRLRPLRDLASRLPEATTFRSRSQALATL